jgi:hypothetical protein
MPGSLRRRLSLVPGARTTARVVRRVASAARRRGVRLLPLSFAARAMVEALRLRAHPLPSEAPELAVRLNAALRALHDDDGSNRWLHHRWVRIFEEMFDVVGDDVRPRRGFHAVCFGAGSRNPLALPLLLFLGGSARVHVVDPELAADTEDWRLRWGLQELALRILVGDVVSRHFVRPTSDMNAMVDLRTLFFGADVASALRAGAIQIVGTTLEDARIAPRTVGLVTSRSVLEHVNDPDRCFDTFAAMMDIGGVMYHDIDFTAHDARGPFVFYYNGRGAAPSLAGEGLNGLRLGDYLRAFTDRGFDSRIVKRTVLPDHVVDRSRLLPRYGAYSDEDLRCSRAVIVSWKRR